MFVCPECGQLLAQAGACPSDGTALIARGDDPIVGTSVGAYRVSRLLGVGGMGRVYKGVHPSIGSRVAIKVLSHECASRPDLVERFFSEARAVNLIRHESIVNVLDLNQLPDGRPFIIMEYLDGAPLNDIVEKVGPMPMGGVARLMGEVLDALGAAHAKGIVHRDLKPDNIYVTPAGHPKVLDFGIAKLRPELGGSSTQTGSLLGTPHYMSPEQATGRGVDHRTDIYAIGVILFECMTGRRPFNADSLFDLLRQHVDVAPPSPRSLRPDMPPALEQVILTTLAKDPNQRFGSAGALTQALMAATTTLPPDQWTSVGPSTIAHMSAQRGIVSGAQTPASFPNAWTGSGAPPTSPNTSPPAHMTPAPPTPMPGQPGYGAPGYAQPYAQPGMTPPPGAPSTVSNGQVESKPPSGGKKGLWLGLGAVVVVGGVVIAAVASSGGGSAPGSGTAAAAPPPGSATPPAGSATPPAGSATPPAGSATPPAGSATPPAGSAAPPSDDDKVASLDDVDLTDADDITRGLADIDKQIAALGPTDKDAANRLVQLKSQLVAARVALTGSATPLPGSGAPPSGSYNGGALAGPGGFDPTKFDLTAYYAEAFAEAKKIYPDAVLWRVDAEGVMPDGKANLTLSDDFSVLYRFISPAKTKRPDNVPLGVKVEQKCVVYVNVEKTEIRSYTVEWDCKDEHTIHAPKCSAQQVWQKAIKLGAPAKNAVGELGYRSDFDGNTLWYFDVGDVFSQTIPDNC
ncbi:MAG: protein kinase [Deltaproteobacteria bacterium]|nr:protein kinase [Deltaproteobacteria bacterium]